MPYYNVGASRRLPTCPNADKMSGLRDNSDHTTDRKETFVSRQERLWAPWRLAYVQSCVEESKHAEQPAELELLDGADPECFLCQAVADRGAERERFVVAQNERTIVVLNRFPYNNGHLLIAPRKHVPSLDAIDSETHLEMISEMDRWMKIMKEEMRAEGFNVGLNLGHIAGAGLPGHLHWHVVPRWNGDTNFMPALAAVKVIPQSLEALWEMLTEKATT